MLMSHQWDPRALQYSPSTLTFRTFFSKISNLLRKSINDVFCTRNRTREKSLSSCELRKENYQIKYTWSLIMQKIKPQNTLVSKPTQKVPWSPSFGSSVHPQKVFDHTWKQLSVNPFEFNKLYGIAVNINVYLILPRRIDDWPQLTL